MSEITEQALKSRIWESKGMEYVFPEQQLPELKIKPSIALCFSGGGARALSAATGQLRALNELGYLDKCQYLSCVSGGSWAGTIFTYYNKKHPEGPSSDEELLGKWTKPTDITRDHLKKSLTKKNLAYGANNDIFAKTLEWVDRGHNAWIFGVGIDLLRNYGLFDYDDAYYENYKNLSYFSYDLSTVNAIKLANPVLHDKNFHLVNNNRPFLVINSSIPYPDDIGNLSKYANFEYTPLTIGRSYKSEIGEKEYGGGLIEPFAFRSKSAIKFISTPNPTENNYWKQTHDLKNTGWVHVQGQDRPQTLADATGTSSAFFVKTMSDIKSIDPEADYWHFNENKPIKGERTDFADGGFMDNYGLLPMIQRGVKLAIVFINTDTPLAQDFNPNSNPKNKCDPYLQSLFGFSNPEWNSWPESYSYPLNHVFPKGDLDLLLKKLKDRKSKGEPLIVSSEHKIVENLHWGIKANKEKMKVVWCYLDKVENWENKIHNQYVNCWVNANNFPNYSTLIPHLHKEQIVLLADFTCDIILEDKRKVLQNAVKEMMVI